MKKFNITLFIVIFTLININIFSNEDTRYNENLNTPQDVSGGGNVSPQTGALNIGVTDLALPGRNGLNFEVTRTYSSTLANVFNMAYDDLITNRTTLHTPADWKYGLGTGWTFSWPFIYRDIDDTDASKKLNLFWGGSVYEILEGSLGVDNDKQSNIKFFHF
jgi:hypothetical protein